MGSRRPKRKQKINSKTHSQQRQIQKLAPRAIITSNSAKHKCKHRSARAMYLGPAILQQQAIEYSNTAEKQKHYLKTNVRIIIEILKEDMKYCIIG